MFAVALAFGLAFGLGGRDTASRMWQTWYARGQEVAPRLEQAAETAAQRSESTVQQTSGSPAPAAAPSQQPGRPGTPRRYRPTTE